MPFVMQTAVGRRDHVRIFGRDYPTADGTCIRDYIHICDLGRGHLLALERQEPGFAAINLGRGAGASGLQVIKAVGAACGRPEPYRFRPRRPGDVAETVADPALATARLGWRATGDLATVCRDAWRWQCRNPDGYGPRPSGISVSPHQGRSGSPIPRELVGPEGFEPPTKAL